MSNLPYDSARYRMVTGAFNWLTANLVLDVWSGTPDFVPGDRSTSDIAARGAVLRGSSQPVTQKTVAPDGTVQTNQVVVPAVAVGAAITFFTLRDGAAAGSLVLFVDEAIELPFTPNGLDMVVQPDWLSTRGWFRA